MRLACSIVVLLLAVCPAALPTAADDAPVRPAITGIGHIAFHVSDTGAARHFYGTVLGLAERPAAGGRLDYVVGHRQYLRVAPDLAPGTDERLDHVAFASADVQALRSYLSARGVAMAAGLEPCERDGFFVQDPDGHPIEFVQAAWPPPARPSAGHTSSDDASASRGGPLSTRILHAGLIVHDEQAAHRFYRDVLGFSEFWRGGRTEAVTNWVNMRVPDGTDYLEYMLTSGRPDRGQRGSSHHACLLVPDVQDAYETVARRTAGEVRPPNVGRNGRWQLNLFDPDGTRIELMEPFRVR